MGNEKLEKVLPNAWEQARKNVEEDKRKFYNNPVRFSDMSEKDQSESIESMDDDYVHDPSESLKQSLIEMKLIREGKLKAKTWDEYLEEVKNE